MPTRTWTEWALEFAGGPGASNDGEFKPELLAAALPKALAEGPESSFRLLALALRGPFHKAALPMILAFGADPLAKGPPRLRGDRTDADSPPGDRLTGTVFDDASLLADGPWSADELAPLAEAAGIPASALRAGLALSAGDVLPLETLASSGPEAFGGLVRPLFERFAEVAQPSLYPRLAELGLMPEAAATRALLEAVAVGSTEIVRWSLAAGARFDGLSGATETPARAAVEAAILAARRAADKAAARPARKRRGRLGSGLEGSAGAASSEGSGTPAARSPNLEAFECWPLVQELAAPDPSCADGISTDGLLKLARRLKVLELLSEAGALFCAENSKGENALSALAEASARADGDGSPARRILGSLFRALEEDLRRLDAAALAARGPAVVP